MNNIDKLKLRRFIIQSVLNDMGGLVDGCELLKQIGEETLSNKLLQHTKNVLNKNVDHELLFEIKKIVELITAEEEEQWKELVKLKKQLSKMPRKINMVSFPIGYKTYQFLDGIVDKIKFRRYIHEEDFKGNIDIDFYTPVLPTLHPCAGTMKMDMFTLPSSSVLNYMNYLIEIKMHKETYE